MRNPAEWFAFWQTTLAGLQYTNGAPTGLAGLRLAFLNPIRHGAAVALVSVQAHEDAVHVGTEDLVGMDHDFALVRADDHWFDTAG